MGGIHTAALGKITIAAAILDRRLGTNQMEV